MYIRNGSSRISKQRKSKSLEEFIYKPRVGKRKKIFPDTL